MDFTGRITQSSEAVMKSIALKTYAKINLTLDVTGVREDGYHEVCMVMHAIGLHDDMTVRILDADEFRITLKSNRYYVPTDRRNTAWKAAELMLEKARSMETEAVKKPFEIRIDIGKEIPVAAGLAGGSSNAAGAVIALDRLLQMNLSVEELCDLGSRIGADVPFSILSLLAAEAKEKGIAAPAFGEGEVSTAALAEGIGEILTPLHPLKLWCVLVKPHFSVSTKEVYQALDAIEVQRHPDTESVLMGMHTGNLPAVRSGMANVLEEVTLVQRPETAMIRTVMQKHCPDMTMMSGSGPTVYSLFGGKKAAMQAYRALQEELADADCSIYLTRTL